MLFQFYQDSFWFLFCSRGSHLFGYLPDRLFVCLFAVFSLSDPDVRLFCRRSDPVSRENASPLTATTRQPPYCCLNTSSFLGLPQRESDRGQALSSHSGEYSKSAYPHRELKETKPDIINDRWAPAGLNKWIHPSPPLPRGAGRETLLFLLREGGAERTEYSRPLKMYRDILSGGTSPTSEGETQTVWKMMDECIFLDISVYFVRSYI